MKTCTDCLVTKELSEFHKSRNTLDGYHTICKACRRTMNAAYGVNIRRQVVLKLGVRCSNPNCGWINEDGTRGCSDIRALQIDHINGGGYKEFYLAGGSGNFYRELLNLPIDQLKSRYQMLCANCNWIKRHVREREHRLNV
jgi:hypothetical protein